MSVTKMTVDRHVTGGLGSNLKKWELVVGDRNWAGLKGPSVASRRGQFECMKPFSQRLVLHVCEQRCRVALSKDHFCWCLQPLLSKPLKNIAGHNPVSNGDLHAYAHVCKD